MPPAALLPAPPVAALWPAYATISCPFKRVALVTYADAKDAPSLATLLRSLAAMLPCCKSITVVVPRRRPRGAAARRGGAAATAT